MFVVVKGPDVEHPFTIIKLTKCRDQSYEFQAYEMRSGKQWHPVGDVTEEAMGMRTWLHWGRDLLTSTGLLAMEHWRAVIRKEAAWPRHDTVFDREEKEEKQSYKKRKQPRQMKPNGETKRTKK